MIGHDPLGGNHRRVAAFVRRSAQVRTFPPRRVKDLSRPRRGAPIRIALTFDDGPHPEWTPRILDALERAAAKATFFMCGVTAERHPELVEEVVRRGHAVGAHSWDHTPLPALDSEGWGRQVDHTREVIEGLTGLPITMVRPPQGLLDERAVRTLVASGTWPVLWSCDGRDWTTSSADQIVETVREGIEPEAIVLLHDGCGDLLRPDAVLPPGVDPDRSRTVDAVEALLPELRRAGIENIALPQAPGPVPRRLGGVLLR